MANEKVGRISGKRVEISEWTIYLLLEREGAGGDDLSEFLGLRIPYLYSQ